MITKLICPTDFSEAANNATEYAAKLAREINAELLLLNIYQVPIGASLVHAQGMSMTDRDSTLLASERLKEMSEEIAKIFHIPCTYEVDVTNKSLTDILKAEEGESTMIVMGTNGTDNLYDFFFGTNTYHVIKNTNCPVLLLPSEYSFGTYKNIVFTLAYEEKGRLALKQLHEFVKHFDAYITFLHISEHDTEISREVFRVEREQIEEVFKDITKKEFKRIYSEDIPDALQQYINKNQVDLLVLAARHRNWFRSLFSKKPLLADLSATPSLPILVFHS